jgi:hypothetical protein
MLSNKLTQRKSPKTTLFSQLFDIKISGEINLKSTRNLLLYDLTFEPRPHVVMGLTLAICRSHMACMCTRERAGFFRLLGMLSIAYAAHRSLFEIDLLAISLNWVLPC